MSSGRVPLVLLALGIARLAGVPPAPDPAGGSPVAAQDRPAPAAAPRAPDRPNLLLVTLDTTRADAIAPWGPGGVAPRLDALAAESVVSMNARAPAPLTFPSHASMLTGLYPFAHGVRDNDLYQLDPAAQTAAKLLHDAGWRTEAVLAATVLRANTGLSNGFETYADVRFRRSRNVPVNTRRAANEVTDLALERLAVDDPRPWFLWLHYFDPHYPYHAPGTPDPTASKREQYEAQVRFLDQELARVIARLEESGALARTWILVCGDHGEGVNIQQEVAHGYLAEEGTLRIPLFVRRPDGLLRGRLEALATAADVYPTLLSIAGLYPPYAIHGRNLLESFEIEQRGGPEADVLADRALWFETWAGWHVYGWARLEGVIAGGFKYVRNVKDELFDVRDPAAPDLEKRNLAGERPEILRALQQRYAALPEQPVARFDSAAPDLPQEEISRLMELGYLARSIGDDDVTKNGTLDPREHYSTAIDIEWALKAVTEGKADDGIKVLEAIVRRYPQSAVFRDILGKALMQADRKPAAMEVFRSALRIDPGLVSSNFYVGVMLRQKGRLEEARRHLEKTVELSPVHLEGWLQLRALHNTANELASVLRDTIVVIRLAASMGEKDGDDIAQNSLDTWLPNVLKKLAGRPRLRQLVEESLAALPAEPSPAIDRAREILKAALPAD
jgi:arylsulfatase A-like enzyme